MSLATSLAHQAWSQACSCRAAMACCLLQQQSAGLIRMAEDIWGCRKLDFCKCWGCCDPKLHSQLRLSAFHTELLSLDRDLKFSLSSSFLQSYSPHQLQSQPG